MIFRLKMHQVGPKRGNIISQGRNQDFYWCSGHFFQLNILCGVLIVDMIFISETFYSINKIQFNLTDHTGPENMSKAKILFLVVTVFFFLPLISSASQCSVIAGEPVFFSETAIEQCMEIMASLMDANESFSTGTRAYWDKLRQLVSRKEAFVLPEDRSVTVLKKKDYIRGLIRLPGVKILVSDPISGNEFWVFLDSLQCR